ncbi:MAG: FkbM family methyltransferase [Candidatus Yanofskybacteria bacterium]|nr:FkbM family methyltransferase [Candidatus Yanofskybacteria bacterium]
MERSMTLEEKRSHYIQLFNAAAVRATVWEKRNKIKKASSRTLSFLKRVIPQKTQNKEARTFWGYPLLLPGTGSDAFRLATFGTLGYENEDKLIRFFLRAVQPTDVFYDIGASYGFYTYLALEFITEGEVHAFEPLTEVFEFLKHNTQEKAQCVLNPCVLSDQEGAVKFYAGYPSGMSSTMVAGVAESNTWNRYKKREVVSLTLDSYLKNHRKPTLIKIDAEGAERLIIKGGRAFFSSSNPTIMMEVWGGKKGKQFSFPAIQQLLWFGYLAYEITPEGWLKQLGYGELLPSTSSFDNIVFRK